MKINAQRRKRSAGLEKEIPVVPAVYGLHLLRFLHRKGIGRRAILDGSNLDSRFFEHPDHYLSMRQLEPLLTRVRELMPSSATAFEFGRELGPVSHGVLGFTLLRPVNFREMVHSAVEYLRVRLPLMDIRIDESKEGIFLTIEHLWDLGPLRDFVAQIYMGSLCTMCGMITRNISLQFDFAPPENPAVFERLAQCRVRFSADANQAFMSFSSETPGRFNLNAEIFTSPNSASEMDLEDDREVVVQVRHMLLTNPGRNGTLSRVARELGLSPRSLRRKLAGAGFSFSELRNEVRREFATRYLTGTTMPLDKIAYRLGYSDQASFSKAFRSWTGRNPGTVRREAREK